ncbi:MAG: PQQ-binding-like beta-propeller repeat protein [Planctomycetota bacterium]
MFISNANRSPRASSWLRISRPSSVATLLLTVLLTAAAACGQGLPKKDLPKKDATKNAFLMHRGDLHNTGQSPSATDAVEGKVEWTFTVASQVAVSPLSEGNIVYFADTLSKIYAVDIEKQEILWQTKPRAARAKTMIKGAGPKKVDMTNPVSRNLADQSFEFSAPVIAGDRLIGATRQGTFFAVDKKTGEILWEKDLGAEIYSSMRYADGKILFGTLDKYYYAVDPADGSIIWKYECGDIVGSTPAISVRGRKIYLLCYDKNLHIINLKTGKGIEVIRIGYRSNSSVLLAEGCLFFTATGHKFICFDLYEKNKRWEHDSVTLTQHGIGYQRGKGVIFITLSNRFRCYRIGDGGLVWEIVMRDKSGNSPCIGKELVYSVDNSGKIYAANMKTGKEIWTQSMEKASSAAPILVNGRLIVCDAKGRIYVLK